MNKFITTTYKKKLIILDNASSHRNESIKEQITENNELLYTVPYQHYTNAIENFFSIFKNKLRKFNDIGLIKLEDNIKKIINEIPKEKYKNIFNGTYNRTDYYYKQKNQEKKL